MTTEKLDSQLFTELVKGGAKNLRANAATVNDLNVFPIPDGDTGDNMCMTMDGGVNALCQSEADSIEFAAQELARGMLLSARGNSGVILSQLFAGAAEGLRGCDMADVSDLARAMKSGVKKAYEAVITPTEGTILTVAREAAEYAAERITEKSTIESFIADYEKQARITLEKTPEILAVLKEAGVIDSGGAGLSYIVEGMGKILRGEEVSEKNAAVSTAPQIDTDLFTSDSEMKYGYCTEFLLRLQKSKTDPDTFDTSDLISHLSALGDSIVALKSGTAVKVHIHTMSPGNVLNYCQKYGEYLTLKIENMCLQHNETLIKNSFYAKEVKKKAYGVVACATGDGIKEIFRSLGADAIVDGGQCSNPSAEDFLRSFEEVNAETIFVLPNNSNVILAAKQAAKLYDRANVYVVGSKTVGDGHSALCMLDFTSGDIDTIMQNFNDAMTAVKTGMVTYSVRDTSIFGADIRKDDYIGFCGKELLSCEKDKIAAAESLIDKLPGDDNEVIIIFAGSDAAEYEADEVEKYAKKKYPEKEIYLIDGGQDIYPFIIAAE